MVMALEAMEVIEANAIISNCGFLAAKVSKLKMKELHNGFELDQIKP